MKQIIIIAPIWEIYQRRVINLDGAPEYKYMDHLRIEIIRSAVKFIRINGLPGEQGRPGGSFFGVADTTINGENLNISCNGGIGSNGNDGFNGLDYESYHFKLFYPGIGGKGGEGGISGEIQIFLLNNSTILNIKKSTVNGVNGKSGITGTFTNCRHKRILVELVNIKKKIASLSRSEIDSKLKINSQIIQQNKINYFSETVADYRKYIINNILKNNYDTTFYLNVYRKFNSNVNLLKYLTPSDFVKELLDLEYYYYSLELNITNFHFMYMSYKEGIELYKTVTQNIQISTDFKTMFSKLHDMTMKKVSEFHRNSNTEAVLKIAVYLEQSIEDGAKLKNYQIRKKLQTIGNKFKENFEQEIKEAGKLISEDLKAQLDEKIDNLNKQIEKLIKEINEKIDASNKNIEKLKEKKKELENKMILRNLFTIFQFVLLGLSFINPACAIAASVLTKGLSYAEEKLVDSDDEVKYNEIKLPEAVTEFVNKSAEYYNEKAKKDLEIVQDKLKAIKESKDKLNLPYDEAKPLIDIDKEVQEQCISKSIQVSNRQKCMIDILDEKETELTEKSEKKNQKYERSLQVMKTAEKSLDVVNLGIDRYNKHAKDAAAKDSIDRQISKQYDEIRKLEIFKENIYKKLGPQIDRIRNDLHKSSDKFAMSSRAVLEYQKFKMDEYLTDASTELSTLTKGFKVEGEVAKIIEKIKKTMSTIINMHTLVKNFKNELNNAEYIKVIAMAPFDITNLNDPQIVEDFTALEEIYYSNRVIDDYNKLTIAMKGYAYPLIEEFSEFMTSPNEFFNNSMQKASIIVEKMKSLKLNLNKRIGHGGLFKQVKETKFGNGGSKSAFYKWNSSNYSSAIRDILEGKEVKLFANISQGEHFNALKFRDVDILLTSTDPEINEELKNLLKDYDIYLNHNGDSYYECNKKVHLIKSGSSGTLFKFLSSSRKRRSLYDNNNDYILSPFATWTIRLHRDNGNNEFAPLAKFVDKVNVELIGDGQFMPVDDYICSDYFLNFYKQELQVN
ncbi:reticulocyte-binding protein homolog 2a-like isoform X2 [Leptopilina boulardi]|nr:reticulocyte-binding protein homolog 2a-like isoform X2 [Leptopilina boulardi]